MYISVLIILCVIQTNDNSYTDVCPLLVGDYTQPIGIAQDLTLITLNTPVSCMYYLGVAIYT